MPSKCGCSNFEHLRVHLKYLSHLADVVAIGTVAVVGLSIGKQQLPVAIAAKVSHFSFLLSISFFYFSGYGQRISMKCAMAAKLLNG